MKPAPRLEIDLGKIFTNASKLIKMLAPLGLSVTGVTKSTLGSADIAGTLVKAGVRGLADSRIENIESMEEAGIVAGMTLIRSPMLSQIERVVKHADISFNTEIEVIRKLSFEAEKTDRSHSVILMVEMGDLREGIMPEDLFDIVRETHKLPNIIFKGIGTNLACRSGVSPDSCNMTRLSKLANLIEESLDLQVETISGGNSANINWALSGVDIGRINNLRLGESILFGCEALNRQPIPGLHRDAITLIAEVIESKIKPSLPTGKIAQNAFGEVIPVKDRGLVRQSILAIGRQDVDPSGLTPPDGLKIMDASSDHLVMESYDDNISVGTEVAFETNYGAFLRAMTSPFISKVMIND